MPRLKQGTIRRLLAPARACLDYLGEVLGRKPFAERLFDDEDSIETFARAVNGAEEMSGAIDYGAYFLMTVRLVNGNSRGFHLNIHRTEDEQTGLLVRLENTNVGYRIPVELSERLEDIIYDPS